MWPLNTGLTVLQKLSSKERLSLYLGHFFFAEVVALQEEYCIGWIHHHCQLDNIRYCIVYNMCQLDNTRYCIVYNMYLLLWVKYYLEMPLKWHMRQLNIKLFKRWSLKYDCNADSFVNLSYSAIFTDDQISTCKTW